jgi:hypothetical protein
MGNEPLRLAQLAKRLSSSRDGSDATFPPKVTGNDGELYAAPPLFAGFKQVYEKPG